MGEAGVKFRKLLIAVLVAALAASCAYAQGTKEGENFAALYDAAVESVWRALVPAAEPQFEGDVPEDKALAYIQAWSLGKAEQRDGGTAYANIVGSCSFVLSGDGSRITAVRTNPEDDVCLWAFGLTIEGMTGEAGFYRWVKDGAEAGKGYTGRTFDAVWGDGDGNTTLSVTWKAAQAKETPAPAAEETPVPAVPDETPVLEVPEETPVPAEPEETPAPAAPAPLAQGVSPVFDPALLPGAYNACLRAAVNGRTADAEEAAAAYAGFALTAAGGDEGRKIYASPTREFTVYMYGAREDAGRVTAGYLRCAKDGDATPLVVMGEAISLLTGDEGFAPWLVSVSENGAKYESARFSAEFVYAEQENTVLSGFLLTEKP